MKISSKLIYQYMVIFFNFSPTSNHLHPLQVENCDSNSRLVVDEMTMVNPGLKGLNLLSCWSQLLLFLVSLISWPIQVIANEMCV